MSTRKIQRQLENIYGRRISHVAVWGWIIKYSKLAGELLIELMPKLSEEWQVDETTIPCREGRGLLKWFWQIVDEETRWMIATHISEDRDTKEATNLFRKALELAKSKPKILITDGLWAYEKAYKKVFWTRYKAERPVYVRNLGIRNGLTNKVERLHGTLKDKTKPLRGFKKLESTKAILTGWMVHYNLVRPHQALKRQTPARKAGLETPNNWKAIIQQVTLKKYNPSLHS